MDRCLLGQLPYLGLSASVQNASIDQRKLRMVPGGPVLLIFL